MTRRKKILFYALLTLLTLAAIEGMARLAYYFALGEGYGSSPSPAAAAVGEPGGEAAAVTREELRSQRERAFVVSHPYWGYTDRSPNSPLNVIPPPQAGPDTVLIGLLGGSVSWNAAPYFQEAVARYLDEQGSAKEPVVIRLSWGSLKQPQQLNMVSFMLLMGGNFDLLVNLDGHNELANSYINFTRGVFPFYPFDWEKLVALTREELALVAEIRAARTQLSQLEPAAGSNPFRHTALYGLLRRYRIQRAETRILELNRELSAQGQARTIEQQGPLVNYPDRETMHQEAVRVWYRGSVLLDALAARAGADYYHFLQPNQYIPDAKPLSPEERQYHIRAEVAATTNFAETYPLLAGFGEELQRRGINFFDLTQIFNNHPETLYRDDCCHLNQRGNELLAAAMVEGVAPALERHGAAPAPGPADILTVAAPLPLPAAATPALLSGQPDGEGASGPDYQVSRRPGNLLVYLKESCRTEHTSPTFFLHITPGEVGDLPTGQQSQGFENRDFQFDDAGVHSYHFGSSNCIIEVQLPDYPIAALRTGQYNAGGEIWAVELPFPQ